MNPETKEVFIKTLREISESINFALDCCDDEYFQLREARTLVDNTLEAVQS